MFKFGDKVFCKEYNCDVYMTNVQLVVLEKLQLLNAVQSFSFNERESLLIDTPLADFEIDDLDIILVYPKVNIMESFLMLAKIVEFLKETIEDLKR